MLTSLGQTGEITGSGSPEGVVAAAVGTRFTDRDATCGALCWIKATGTGNTGWRVTFGDTGWRAISTWTTGAVVTGAALPSGMAPKTSTAGGIYIRRFNDFVNWRIAGASAAGAGFITLVAPTGFGCGTPVPYPLGIAGRSTATGVFQWSISGASGNLDLNIPGAMDFGDSTANKGTEITYLTRLTSWPTALPGAAA